MSALGCAAMRRLYRVSPRHHLIPYRADRGALGDKLVSGNKSGLTCKRKVMGPRPVRTVGGGEHIDGRLRYEIRRSDRFELADGVGEHRHGRVVPGPLQRPVLREELDIGDPAGILLEVLSAVAALGKLPPHALAHRPHLLPQSLAPDRMA